MAEKRACQTGFEPEIGLILVHSKAKVPPNLIFYLYSFEEEDNDIADLISTFGLSPEVGRKQQKSNLGGGRMSKKADGNTSDESNSGGATLKAKLPKFSNFDLNGSAGNSMETPRRFRDGELINSLNSILSEVRKFLT